MFLRRGLSFAGALQTGLAVGHRAPRTFGLLVPSSGITSAYHHAWSFCFFVSEGQDQDPKVALNISTLWKKMFTASSPPKARSSQATVQMHVFFKESGLNAILSP